MVVACNVDADGTWYMALGGKHKPNSKPFHSLNRNGSILDFLLNAMPRCDPIPLCN